MPTLTELVVKIGANTKGFENSLKQMRRSLDKSARMMKSVGTSMSIGLTAPLVLAGKQAVSFFNEFNAGMANIATLIPDNTARIMELGGAVRETAVETGKSTSDISAGLFQVVSAFGDSAASADLLRIAARAATAGLAETTDAINLISAVTKGYGDVTSASAQHVADLAFKTNELGQTTFPELAASMGSVVPLAQALKVSQEELFTVFATLTGVTGNTSEVATQLSGVLRAMVKPTDDMSKAVAGLGFDSAKSMVETLGLKGSLDALIGTTDGTTEAMAKLFGRAEPITATLALTGAQSDVFAEKLEKMANASGAADLAFKQQAEGVNKLGFQMDQAKVRVGILAEDFGNTLAPMVLKAVAVFESILGAFKNLSPAMKELVVGAGLVVAAIGPMVLIAGNVVSAYSALLPVIAKVGVGFVTFSTAAKAAIVASGGLATALGVLGLAAVAALALVDLTKAVMDYGDASSRLTFVTDVLIKKNTELRKSLAEKGIKAFREIGESVEQYNTRLVKLFRATIPNFGKAVDKVSEKTDDQTDATDAINKALAEYQRQLEASKTKLDKFDLKKAIQQANDYDKALKVLVAQGLKQLDEIVKPKLTPALIELTSQMGNADTAALGMATTMQQRVTPMFKEGLGATLAFEGALQTLGIKSTAMKNKELRDLSDAVNTVRIAFENGKASSDDLKNAQNRLKDAMNDGSTKAVGGLSTALDDLGKQISDDLLKLFSGEGSIADVGKAAFDTLKSSILNIAGESVMGLLSGAIKGIINQLVGKDGLNSALNFVFSGEEAASTVSEVAGTGSDVISGASKVASGASKAGSKIAGAASGGLAGLVIAGADLVSGVFMNFQMRRLNKLADLIEVSTRQANNALGGSTAGGGILKVLQLSLEVLDFRIANLLEFGNNTKANEQSRDHLSTIRDMIAAGGLQFINPSLDTMKDRLLTLIGAVEAFGEDVKTQPIEVTVDVKVDDKGRASGTIKGRGRGGVVEVVKKAIKLNKDGLRTKIKLIPAPA